MQAFEKSGLWWLPSNPDNVVAGKLSFSEERNLSLHLMGIIGDNPGIGRIVEYPLIIGVTDDNKEVTLHQCTRKGSRLNSTGFTSQDFRVRVVYIGAHFTNVDRIVFNDIRIEYSYLFDWVNISGFLWTMPNDKENKPRKYILSYTEPDDVIIEIPGGNIRLTSSFNTSHGSTSVTMSQSTQMGVYLEQAISFSEWLKLYISPLQDFLSLAACRPNAVTNIHFRVDIETGDEAEPIRKSGVETIFEPVFYEKEDLSKINSQDLLFTLSDLDDVSTILNRWLQIRNELKTVSSLFFGSQYGPAKYIDSRFLIAIQAVEMYHRERHSNLIQPEVEHREMVKAIVCAVPKEYRRWLQEQIAFSNEPRLAQRIQVLLDISWDILGPLVKDKDLFVRKVKDTRNYYTHYNPRLAAKAIRGADLHWINEALFFLLQRCYLHELGFSSEKSIYLFQKNQRYINALVHAKYPWNEAE